MEIGGPGDAVRADHRRHERVQVRLGPRRGLQRRRLDLEEAFGREMAADEGGKTRPRRQARPPVGMAGRGPEGRGGGQGGLRG